MYFIILTNNKMELVASDNMICNTRAHNTYKHARENDGVFLQRMNNTQATSIRDLDLEHRLRIATQDPRKYVCSDAIKTRGLNASRCGDNKPFCQGWSCYTNYHLDEFLLTPCKTNTWRNHIECDEDKCCSVHHQMFMNHTKRI
jgi:hypothetical protein